MIVLLLAACAGGPGVEPAEGGAEGLVMTTLSPSYDAGTLSVVDVAAGEVADDVATVHSDAVVRVEQGSVWQINRLLMDTVRRYEPGAWSSPTWELSVGAGSNPHDVALCGGLLWVSRYEETELWGLDPVTGERLATVDLASEADDDGIPEMSDLVVDGETLFVGLQRLRRLDGWAAEPDGRVARVDCGTHELVGAWQVGPNPVLRELPGEGEALVIAGDGVSRLALDDGEMEAWVGPTDGWTWVDAAAGEGGAVALIGRSGADHVVACGGEDGVVVGPSWPNYVSGVTVAGDTAWLAVRPGWTDPNSGGWLQGVDLMDCTITRRFETRLPPFSVAVLP